MVNRHSIDRERVLYTVSNKEFPEEILTSGDIVVVIMTQDWCPQWQDMQRWVYSMDTSEDINVYDVTYNNTDYFDEFRSFKENIWGNHSIPYLRYYKKGKLINQSNYVNEERFKQMAGI